MHQYPVYQEYVIQDDSKVAQVANGNKSLTEAGILDELNSACQEMGAEVDWGFTMAFPKMFMLRTWVSTTKKTRNPKEK